jgi:hypothetical protein
MIEISKTERKCSRKNWNKLKSDEICKKKKKYFRNWWNISKNHEQTS